MKLFAALLLAVAIGAPAAAQEKPASAPETVTAGPPRALKYRFVPAQSSITFEVPTSFHVIQGKVDAWHGSVAVEPEPPGVLQARIVVRADGLETGKAKRDLEFRDKMFEAARFPEIVFEGASYKGNLSKVDPGAVTTVEVTGTLTMHGVSKPIQTSIECAVLPDHVVVAGAVSVVWKSFGLGDLSKMLLRIKEPMLVAFRLWAVPE
ncbi:MAG TPA: YceI family protein [Thermoanaerobaculia bacterium]|nr:YceI family protein [Thermoanaerobaculia bacterium]